MADNVTRIASLSGSCARACLAETTWHGRGSLLWTRAKSDLVHLPAPAAKAATRMVKTGSCAPP